MANFPPFSPVQIKFNFISCCEFMKNCLISATARCLTVDHNSISLLYFKAGEWFHIFKYYSVFGLQIIQRVIVYLTGSSLLCLLSLHRLWFMMCLIEKKGGKVLSTFHNMRINKYNRRLKGRILHENQVIRL